MSHGYCLSKYQYNFILNKGSLVSNCNTFYTKKYGSQNTKQTDNPCPQYQYYNGLSVDDISNLAISFAGFCAFYTIYLTCGTVATCSRDSVRKDESYNMTWYCSSWTESIPCVFSFILRTKQRSTAITQQAATSDVASFFLSIS